MLKILEHSRLLMKWKDVTKVTLDHVVELVSSAAGVEDGGARRFLQSALTTSGAVTFLIDGVDEVAPVYMDITVLLLEELLKLPIKRIWVSTRPEVAPQLRRVLRPPPLALEPLSHEEQLQFLRCRLTSATWEEVMQRLEGTGDLLANPLHLMMTTEIFNKSTEFFCRNSITLLNLYEEFTKLKNQEYQEKFPDSCNLHLENNDAKYEKSAMVFLFCDDSLSKHLPIDKYEADIVNDKHLSQAKEKRGICWLENKKIRFIHQTFAEYFAAKWFLKNTKKWKGAREFVLTLNKWKYKATRIQIFLQDMLAEEWPLHAAAWRRDMKEIQRHLDNDFGTEQRGQRDPMLQGTWFNYLEWVYTKKFNSGRLDAVKGFLHRIFKKEPWFSGSSRGLCDAARSGCHGVVSEWLRHKKFSTKSLNKALRESASGNEEGHARIIKLLLETNNAESNDVKVLHLAAEAGNAASVDFLLKRSGRNLNAHNFFVWTALHLALQGHHHEVVERVLAEERVDVNAESYAWDILPRRDYEIWTPLCYASAVNCVPCAEKLLSRGAQVDGLTVPPLVVTAKRNNIDMLRFLLGNGADVNARTSFKETALHAAIKGKSNEAVKVLLADGADLTLRDGMGQSVFDMARESQNEKILQVVAEHFNSIAFSNDKKNKASSMALVWFAYFGNKDQVVRILESFNFSPQDLGIALREALKRKSEDQVDIIRELLDHGAKDIIDKKDKGTALHLAIKNGNAAIVTLLVERSVYDVTARDEERRTALHLVLGFNAVRHYHDAAQNLLEDTFMV